MAMKNIIGYLILAIIVFFSLLQGAFLPLNLVLLLVLFWAGVNPDFKKNLWLAFGAGLILDFARGTTLGFSSLFLVAACTLFRPYSLVFDSRRPFFFAIFVFLAEFFWQQIFFGFFVLKRVFLLAFLAFFLKILTRSFFERKIKI